jgi:hypothetical protein
METMTHEQQEAARRERLAEVGTEPPCPFCGVPRVRRSDYIRCNREGINWLEGEDITKDPRASRGSALSTRRTDATQTERPSGVPTAEQTTSSERER